MLEEKIHQDLKNAQIARDELKLSTLRMLISAIGYAKIEKGSELTDDEVIALVQKEIKKRRESAEGFRKGNREEQALKEEAEAKILEVYLPPQISEEDLVKLVDEAVSEIGAVAISDMGKVMAILMPKVGKSAEPGRVSAMVKERLPAKS